MKYRIVQILDRFPGSRFLKRQISRGGGGGGGVGQFSSGMGADFQCGEQIPARCVWGVGEQIFWYQ